jgi:hypothetical protein
VGTGIEDLTYGVLGGDCIKPKSSRSLYAPPRTGWARLARRLIPIVPRAVQ